MPDDQTITEALAQFLSDYYREDLAKIAQEPNDRESLWVDWQDLWRFEPDLADDLLDEPDLILGYLEEAITLVDLPLEVSLDHVTVRVSGLGDEAIQSPGEIRQEHGGRYVGVHGVLERVTSTSDLPETLVFNCQRCMDPQGVIPLPQDITQDDIQEPYECPDCGRQGPFKLDERRSEWSDYAKLRVQARPSDDTDGKLSGFVLNDLIDVGGENGLLDRAGEPVTVYGIVRREQKTGRGEKKLLHDHLLDAKAIEFVRDDETINVDEHKETFTELASQPDAVDLFAQSIAPNLHTTEAWDAAFEFAVAYLFGAPRIDIDRGPTYRGDLHFLMITDFGMGKSTFKEDIEAYSPKCISKSTTALSSGVGLTAAAVKDDFGEGQWTIKPGLLVRANGGHLLLDEIDKGPDELTDMNDALEGEQVVDIEKAGKSATYESRTGLLALGNPTEGRFDPNSPIAEQLGISETLLSRFDGIVTMEDQEDVEQDSNVAETYGRSYTEAQGKQYGDREEFDQLDRHVPVDVGQAWIKHARENVNPLLRFEQFEELKSWYAEDVRQLNSSFAANGEGQDMPVPATVRVLGAAVKMSIAFARCHLRDEVNEQDIARAKKLGKRLVKQNWNGESFDATKNVTSQKDRKERVIDYIRKSDGTTREEIKENIRATDRKVENDIDRLSEQGEIVEETDGTIRWI